MYTVNHYYTKFCFTSNIRDIGRPNFELSWFERQRRLQSEHTDVVNKYTIRIWNWLSTRGVGTGGQSPPSFQKTKCPFSGGKVPFVFVKNVGQIAFFWLTDVAKQYLWVFVVTWVWGSWNDQPAWHALFGWEKLWQLITKNSDDMAYIDYYIVQYFVTVTFFTYLVIIKIL
jgi:hypothetical protein